MTFCSVSQYKYPNYLVNLNDFDDEDNSTFGIFFLLFSCKKDSVTPATHSATSEAGTGNRNVTLNTDATKRRTTTPTTTPTTPTTTTTTTTTNGTDNTQTLQSQLNAGNVTLTAGAIYNATGLKVTYALNINGATINMTGTSGTAIKLAASGASITNGSITGNWSNTTSGNPSGVSGINISANNCLISNVSVSSFSAYGIQMGPYNNPSVTYCTIKNTGYIGLVTNNVTMSGVTVTTVPAALGKYLLNGASIGSNIVVYN